MKFKTKKKLNNKVFYRANYLLNKLMIAKSKINA